MGEEAFELGLLFGTETDDWVSPEEEEQTFCFQHLILQEFVAGMFVANQDRVRTK